MKILQWSLSILLPAILIAQPVRAYDYPLSSEAIREAYFLGKGEAGRRADFLGKYTRQLPTPRNGVHVALIQFETPYVVIAERVSQNLSNYFAQETEQEFLGKPGICRLRVQVYFNYEGKAGIQTGGFRTDYTIRLTQGDKEIPSQSRRRRTLRSNGPNSTTVGIEIALEYDAGKIESSTPATVEVLTPDGQDVQATFDLASLR